MLVLKGVALSFYSGKFYASLAHEKRGLSAVYVVLLTLISVLLLLGSVAPHLPKIREVFHAVPARINSLPAIELKDSKLTIDQPTPYTVNLGDDNNSFWIMVDPNYQTTNLNDVTKFMRDNKIFIILTNDKLLALKNAEGELDVRDLSKAQGFSVSRDDWTHLAEFIMTWGVACLIVFGTALIFFAVLLGNFIATFLTALVLAIGGSISKAQLDFSACFRLAAALRIPVSLISALITTVLAGLVESSSIANVLSWLLWLGYIGYSLWASKHFASQRVVL